jgi:AcrR family transcriptional regulator
MPPTKYDKKIIMEKLLEFAMQNGFEDISARKLADYIGCSVMPIYTAYGNIGRLIEEAREKIIDMILESMDKEHIEDPLINACVAVILFARDYEYLYREVFINNSNKVHIQKIIKKIQNYIYITGNSMRDELDKYELDILTAKCWALLQGMAAMVCSRQFEDTSVEYLSKAFREVGINVLRGMLYDKGILYDLKHYSPNICETKWDIFEEK